MAKTLVAYFSASGVTAQLAQKLAAITDAELVEIEPAIPYTAADLDWMDKTSRSSIEMNDPSSRPEIVAKNLDLTDCELVYLGFPIWWYIAPTIVNTFLEAHDFAGKTIVPFATSGGSGMGKTVESLRPSAPDARFLPGKVLNKANDAELRAFVAELEGAL